MPRPFSTVLVLTAMAVSPAVAADPLSGQKLARKCSVCHGKMGISKDPEVPNLAGQSAFYLEKSLKDFRSGAREDRRMSLLVKGLSDDDIDDLSAWYSAIEVTVKVPE